MAVCFEWCLSPCPPKCLTVAFCLVAIDEAFIAKFIAKSGPFRSYRHGRRLWSSPIPSHQIPTYATLMLKTALSEAHSKPTLRFRAFAVRLAPFRNMRHTGRRPWHRLNRFDYATFAQPSGQNILLLPVRLGCLMDGCW